MRQCDDGLFPKFKAPIEYSTEKELTDLIEKQEDYGTLEAIIQSLPERFKTDFDSA